MSLIHQQELESAYVMSTYARKPVELVRGEGMQVFDSEGKSYLDFVAGVGAVSLGHCHPTLVEALASQAARLIHVSNYFYIEKRGEVAQKISNLLNVGNPDASKQPWQSFFANSGAEANECAIKLARLWGKKNNNGGTIVTLNKSFHGRTLTTLAATAQPAKQDAFKPLPSGFIHTPLNDIEALEQLFVEQGSAICAVMVECVQGESGVHPCTPEFLKAASDLTRKYNALLICDEVQCGMYRCGTYPFAFQHYGIVPDIVTIAKGVASGFPTGLCSARSEVGSAMEAGDHGSTFGGSCLAVAAIDATLNVMEEEKLGLNVQEVGQYFSEKLSSLPYVEETRGRGLMLACDFSEEVNIPDVVARAQKEGFLINTTGPHTLRFLPPLVCSREDADALIDKLLNVLNS